MRESSKASPVPPHARAATCGSVDRAGAPDPEVLAPGEAADGDALLLARYAAGDVAAFEQLYARHERPVFRYLLRSVRNSGVAEELLQDVWMSVIRGAAAFEARASFSTWLYRIARNRLIDHWRAADPALLDSLDEPLAPGSELTLGDLAPASTATQPEVCIEHRDQARHYLAAVEALPAAQREAFLLHAQAGLSLEQVGRLTGAGVETVKSRLRYASAKLRDALSIWNPA
jgi:RNA polymerase sigma-70 factor (ECF subfamily)